MSRLFGHRGGAGSEEGVEVVVVKEQEYESELIRHTYVELCGVEF